MEINILEVIFISENKKVGNIGEEISCNFLEQRNCEILERNFSWKYGEIDIIAKDNDEYVFIEVKTRSNLCYGKPREAVNSFKKKRIYKTAKYYLYKKHLENEYIRFDVIEVYIQKNKYKINYLKNVDINY